MTPLHIAAKYGQLGVARLLLQRGAKPDMQGRNGLTALHVAAHYNKANIVLLLLEEFRASPHCQAKVHIAFEKDFFFDVLMSFAVLAWDTRPRNFRARWCNGLACLQQWPCYRQRPGFESHLRPVEFFACNKVSPLNNRIPALTSVLCAPII